MTETYSGVNPLRDSEIEKIRFLQGLINNPTAFLLAQNDLLYNRDLSHLLKIGDVNEKGLPKSTEDFYRIETPERFQISDRLPRILNIGAGAEGSRRLDALNVDISVDGKPEVVAEAQRLPFMDGCFSVVRASHVLEHMPQDQIILALKEWRRVLHKDGQLHIAVPDAEITFKEMVEGKTPKGAPAYSVTEPTAPLTQIYGLGYEDTKTDPRWAHHIIFSYSLLEQFLSEAGFAHVVKRASSEDLAYHNGVDDDSQNHYTLLVAAGNEKLPHAVDEPLPERVFRDKAREFRERHPLIEPTSYVVPVFNEEKNLPHFLAFLENAENLIGAEREFIFVINGCTDRSEEIVRDYLEGSYLNARVVTSGKGIVPAFKAGIDNRTLEGFVGKLDADTIIHPHALDLMHMFLTDNPEPQVTYAEPTPLDGRSDFNQAEHNPVLRSRRLYYHGRTSLYRHNPLESVNDSQVLSGLKAEDIFFSFYYAYFYGLDSMARTPHALVFGRTVGTFDDLVTQVSRTRSEVSRVHEIYPPFQIVENILEREVYPGAYQLVTERALGQAATLDEWTQIRSTK